MYQLPEYQVGSKASAKACASQHSLNSYVCAAVIAGQSEQELAVDHQPVRHFLFSLLRPLQQPRRFLLGCTGLGMATPTIPGTQEDISARSVYILISVLVIVHLAAFAFWVLQLARTAKKERKADHTD